MTTITEKKNQFTVVIDEAISDSYKPLLTIAAEIGYNENANVIGMFRDGMTRLPLDKVVPLAKALDQDPARWLRLWFDAYMPGCLDDILEYAKPGS